MMMSLLKTAKQADQCEEKLTLINKLDIAQSRRAHTKALALITSPKGLAAIFTIGLAKGFTHPSISGQLKKMAVVFGKTNLDDWLTAQHIQEPE
ncbi:hypothetical protein EKO29_15930 [Colwellia sp. Arc7-635]|uniref:hypothetical protein n=1 Tax=Colwellia sp. Arc7-635 TaxID=2497879 RepID=UPI000F84F6F4|nr:hypothetical protein [Colwellia sp. Arc7-635]AZQ85338.1 hypothetical protein EKO29_15930 [Colwellia sp. Arc7-635]